MSGSISFSCLRFRSGGFFASCCATLSPQNVSTDCTGKGEEEAGRQGRGVGGRGGVGVRPRRMGQAPDRHFLGPVTVPEHSRHVCTVCEHKWRTDLGVCFVSSPFVFFCLFGAAHLHILKPVSTEESCAAARRHVHARARTHAAKSMEAFHQCPLPPHHFQCWVPI